MNLDQKNLLAFVLGLVLSVIGFSAFAVDLPDCNNLPPNQCAVRGSYEFCSVPVPAEGITIVSTCHDGNDLSKFGWGISKKAGGCSDGATPDPDTGWCAPPANECGDTAGQVVSSGMYDLGTDDNALPATTACDGTCELSYNGSGVVARQLVSGAYHYFSEGSYTRTPQTCSTSDAPTSSTGLPPASCDPATQDQGTVNGAFVCLNRTTTKTTTESPPVTNPDGSTTQTTTTTDPSKGVDTITTTNTAPDGTKTTSTTTQPTPGTGTNFCQQNPNDPSCKKDDFPWGEVPEAGIIPTHDVPVTTVYTVVGGEGSCPAPQSLAFLGQSLTWEYTPLCTFAEMIRPLVIGMAWLSFGFIIVGGLSRAS